MSGYGALIIRKSDKRFLKTEKHLIENRNLMAEDWKKCGKSAAKDCGIL
jgi:hypothetical protein